MACVCWILSENCFSIRTTAGFRLLLFRSFLILHASRAFTQIFTFVGAFVAVPNKPRIARFLIGNWWIVTFLMIKILTARTFHQLVAALLCECFANTAATVKLILKIHLHVSKVSTLTSPIAHVILSSAWGR